MKPYGVRKIIFMLAMAIGLAPTPLTSANQTPDAIRIRSVFRTSSAGAWGDTIQWAFSKTGPGEMSVYLNDRQDRSFVMNYSEGNRLQAVKKARIGSDGVERLDALTLSGAGTYRLSDGFPLPFDDLNPFDENDDHVVLKKKAGDASFAFTLKRRVENMAIDSAVNQGMVPASYRQKFPDQRLLMISISKGEELMVRQLWVPGEAWWRYEETPFRRSWRLEE